MPYETFDRSKELEPVAADLCLQGIEQLCHVRMSTYIRCERTLFGGNKKVRLLAIIGDEHNITEAHWLYDMIDNTITHESHLFQKSNKHITPCQISVFETGMANKINQLLLSVDNESDFGRRITVVIANVHQQARAKA